MDEHGQLVVAQPLEPAVRLLPDSLVGLRDAQRDEGERPAIDLGGNYRARWA
ncbi:hypothetical protein ATKI12_6488 [Kitasatospora sp. Ki12]